MKSFLQFLKEATASQQAQRLGLVNSGHGDWYDRTTGEFVAKTVQGKLKFFNKRQNVPGKDPNQTDLEYNVSDPNFNDPAAMQQPQDVAMQQAQPMDVAYDEQGNPIDPNMMAEMPPEEEAPPPSDLEVGPLPVPKTKGYLTIAFGRFNPPTIGHLQLFDTAASIAQQTEGDFIIVPSRIQDSKKNPLDPDTKIAFMRRMFPAYGEVIVNDPQNVTIFDVLRKAHFDGYSNIVIVGGEDKIKEYDKMANSYNGKLYEFETIEVVSSGKVDPDSDDIKGVNASKLRKAALQGDFDTFRKGIPPELEPRETIELFDLVRQFMNLKESKELWEVSPKLDLKNLRENYINNKIFKVGDLVENLNTGLQGKIIRRGTNYLICVTEDNMMFKSWIKDVRELNESYKLTEECSPQKNKVKKFINMINKNRKNIQKKNFK